ncbi:hypothetical protein [uncultured Cyclobacterium sp.]|uniref:hypothetical protein n=1 Tax=uncultured Cyclobacterium sp. TaxID=453820 RepID=UPI0030ED246A|tara:strand:+ start:157219 stop:157608 length:390 start_codon:yes stop_codon:yes gene_type:complete
MKEKLESSRPTIQNLSFPKGIGKEELFQNLVIRPVVKLLHDLLMVHFKQYLTTKKIAFSQLSEKEKTNFIESSFNKDLTFRSEIRGLVIGHFSTDEFLLYATMQRGLNKRINSILKERINSNRQNFIDE